MQDKCNPVSELPIIGQCPVCHCITVEPMLYGEVCRTTPRITFFNTICEDCERDGWRYDMEGRVMRIENGKVAEILMN